MEMSRKLCISEKALNRHLSSLITISKDIAPMGNCDEEKLNLIWITDRIYV